MAVPLLISALPDMTFNPSVTFVESIRSFSIQNSSMFSAKACRTASIFRHAGDGYNGDLNRDAGGSDIFLHCYYDSNASTDEAPGYLTNKDSNYWAYRYVLGTKVALRRIETLEMKMTDVPPICRLSDKDKGFVSLLLHSPRDDFYLVDRGKLTMG